MKVLYIHQYFKTPREPGGTRSYWIAQELIKAGHEVVMITSRFPQEEKKVTEIVDGIKVHYHKVDYSNKMGFAKRLFSFLNFMVRSTVTAFKEKNVDRVFATSTPLTIGMPALILKWFKRIPFVFEVRDLWPEVPIQMGALKNPLMRYPALWLEKSIYRNAEHIVALSPGMEKGVLDAGIPQKKVSMVPNMAKIDQFFTREPNWKICEELGLQKESFKIVYFGSLGKANAIEYVIEVANRLKDDSRFEFVIIGRGAMEDYIKDSIEKLELSHAHYLGAFNMEYTSEIVNFCDISLVTFSDYPILGTNSPNKLFDSLSAGKPIIVNSPGWTKDLVNDFQCGVYVDIHQPDDCVEKIKVLSADKALQENMGCNARKLAEKAYDKSILCPKVVRVVESTLTSD